MTEWQQVPRESGDGLSAAQQWDGKAKPRGDFVVVGTKSNLSKYITSCHFSSGHCRVMSGIRKRPEGGRGERAAARRALHQWGSCWLSNMLWHYGCLLCAAQPAQPHSSTCIPGTKKIQLKGSLGWQWLNAQAADSSSAACAEDRGLVLGVRWIGIRSIIAAIRTNCDSFCGQTRWGMESHRRSHAWVTCVTLRAVLPCCDGSVRRDEEGAQFLVLSS